MSSPPAMLARLLSWRGAVLVTLSAVTPTASVVVIAPSAIATAGGSALIAFGLGALLCMGFAACYAEVASAFPLAGGEYSYTARVLGPAPAFAVFVSTSLSIVLVIAALANAVGELVGTPFHGLPPALVGYLLVGASTLVACLRVTVGAITTGAFLFLEVATLGGLATLGFCHAARPIHEAVITGAGVPEAGAGGHPAGAVAWAAVMAAVPVAVFAYNG